MALMLADPAEYGFDSERLARIPAFIQREYLAPEKLPHAAMLISRKGQPVHLSIQGEARPGQALQQDAIYRIASMTKAITSIAFMQIFEEGRVALADPVVKYLPEWKQQRVFVSGGDKQPFITRPPARQMTLFDLLRHTSGLTYSFQERSPIDAAYRKAGIESLNGYTLEEIVEILADIPLLFDPGSGWNYSISTDILGAILQRIEDKPLDQIIAARICDPLGMQDSHFQLPASKADRLPDAWFYDPKKPKKIYDKGADSAWLKPPKLLSGGGGMLASIADYHRFCHALLMGGAVDGVRIIGRRTLDLMRANHLPGGVDLPQISQSMFSEPENAGLGFGLGFSTIIDPVANASLASKGEFSWSGIFSTGFFIDPLEELIMIFMTQLLPSTRYPIQRELKTMTHAALI